MPSGLARKLHKFYINKDAVSRDLRQYGVVPKYLRKWFYNFLILNNVPESVGSTHYLAKVKQADYWYGLVKEIMFGTIEQWRQ